AKRVNESWLAVSLELPPELLDVNFQHIGTPLHVVAPDTIHQEVLGQHTARVKEELAQHLVLRGRELDVARPSTGASSAGVEAQVGESKHVRSIRIPASQERPDSSREDVEDERLDHVVICTVVEAAYLVHRPVSRSQEHDWQLRIGAP